METPVLCTLCTQGVLSNLTWVPVSTTPPSAQDRRKDGGAFFVGFMAGFFNIRFESGTQALRHYGIEWQDRFFDNPAYLQLFN